MSFRLDNSLARRLEGLYDYEVGWCGGEFSVCGWTAGLLCATLDGVVRELYRGLLFELEALYRGPSQTRLRPPGCCMGYAVGNSETESAYLLAAVGGDESSVTVDCVFV